MDVTVEIVGEATHEVTVGPDGTYADLLTAVDLSPHEVSVLVDGRPVPEDQPVETDHVKVLRLIKGGSPSALDFSLPNVGPGPDPLSLSDLAADHDFAVLLFQRDYYCTNCRKQIQQVAERYEEFRERGAEVISILPESVSETRKWQAEYDLPYPLLADPEATVGDQYDQPVRFGVLGRLSDFFGRMPVAAIVDLRGDDPDLLYSHRGTSTWDRPELDEILATLDDARPPHRVAE